MTGGSRKILILGGTGEAAELAGALVQRRQHEVVTAMAGRTSQPRRPAGELRRGGFGGVEGLTQTLIEEGFDLLIDATHPFAAQISDHAQRAAQSSKIPLLRYTRPAWTPTEGDQWISVPDLTRAAAALTPAMKRVFLTSGAKDLGAFAGDQTRWYLLRLIEAPSGPVPLLHHELLLARGPFDEAQELELLRDHAIDVLVSKNSGGPATTAKLSAARNLGLPVIMVERPILPATRECHSLQQALALIDEATGPA